MYYMVDTQALKGALVLDPVNSARTLAKNCSHANLMASILYKEETCREFEADCKCRRPALGVLTDGEEAGGVSPDSSPIPAKRPGRPCWKFTNGLLVGASSFVSLQHGWSIPFAILQGSAGVLSCSLGASIPDFEGLRALHDF